MNKTGNIIIRLYKYYNSSLQTVISYLLSPILTISKLVQITVIWADFTRSSKGDPDLIIPDHQAIALQTAQKTKNGGHSIRRE